MKKYVLTGGPGSGKSSILLALEETGEYVIRESAEDVIKLQQSRGISCPWEYEDFQKRILDLQIKREKKIPYGIERVFIDRGIPDGLAYANKGSEIWKRIKKAIPEYEKIFLIKNLGETENNKIRRENNKEAIKLEKSLEEIYKILGYEPVRVNPGKLNKRLEKIIKAIYK